MRRTFWIAFGIGTHLLFLATLGPLFLFLRGEPSSTVAGGLWIDLLLAAQFGLVHSLLLLPAVRDRLERWIPAPQYGCFFCASTCGSLWLIFSCWRTIPEPALHVLGVGRIIVLTLFFASWVGLFYSLSLSGFGYQTGWTPWWNWLRGRAAPRRSFQPRGLYRWMRHPVYLCFLGLVWFTPVVTVDRALLIVVWTVYVLAGSWLKDRRLAYYVGQPYLRYQAKVPGYPGMILGPLGRTRRKRRSTTKTESTIPAFSAAR